MIQIGDVLPDFEFFTAEGSRARLSDYPADRLLLIFLRHLA